MNIRPIPLFPLSFLLLLIPLISGCSRVEPVAAKAADTVPVVGTAEAQLRPMAEHLTVSSELVPYQEIDVYAKEAGYVKELNVDYGAKVRKGQILAVLEIPELEALLQQDQAAIKARVDEVTRAKNELNRARAQHDVQRLQYNRIAGVAKSQPGLVAQQEVDDWQAKDLASEANVEAIQGMLDTAQSEVAVAKAKLAHDQVLYDYSKITAPFDGVITQRYANLGALMQAGTSTTQSMPLVRLSQENLYRLVIPVPETYVQHIKVNDPVEVRVPAMNATVTGHVARFAADVNSATRTMHTEVDVPNPGGKLLPGVYAEAVLTLNQRGNAVTIPVQAVDRDGEQASVLIVQSDMTVARRVVKLGVQTPNYVEIAGGIGAGDQVVLSDRGALKPGAHVTAHPTEALAYDASGPAEKH